MAAPFDPTEHADTQTLLREWGETFQSGSGPQLSTVVRQGRRTVFRRRCATAAGSAAAVALLAVGLTAGFSPEPATVNQPAAPSSPSPTIEEPDEGIPMEGGLASLQDNPDDTGLAAFHQALVDNSLFGNSSPEASRESTWRSTMYLETKPQEERTSYFSAVVPNENGVTSSVFATPKALPDGAGEAFKAAADCTTLELPNPNTGIEYGECRSDVLPDGTARWQQFLADGSLSAVTLVDDDWIMTVKQASVRQGAPVSDLPADEATLNALAQQVLGLS